VEAEGEEDVEHVKASRNRDSIEGGPPQDGGGPADGSVPMLGEAHAQEGPVMQVDDAAERAQRQVSRPTNSVRLKVQFPDCRQTGQNRRIVCNVFTRAIMTRSDGPYPWHETWPL
jgi:hypothetical protein